MVAGMGFEPLYLRFILTDERSSLGERAEAPPVAEEARRASDSGRKINRALREQIFRAPQQGKQTRSVCEKKPEEVTLSTSARGARRSEPSRL